MSNPGNWAQILPAIRPLYEAWGAAVTAEIHGLNHLHLAQAARRHGVAYHGPKLGRYALDVATRAQNARAWLAAGCTGAPAVSLVNQPAAQTGSPSAGNATASTAPGPRQALARGVEVTLSPKVRITRAPAFVDRRWEPEPGFRRVFTVTPPGVDPLTKEAWR